MILGLGGLLFALANQSLGFVTKIVISIFSILVMIIGMITTTPFWKERFETPNQIVEENEWV